MTRRCRLQPWPESAQSLCPDRRSIARSTLAVSRNLNKYGKARRSPSLMTLSLPKPLSRAKEKANNRAAFDPKTPTG